MRGACVCHGLSNSTALNEIYPITGYKLYYLFDFGDNWLFQIKKSRKKKTEDKERLYPALIKSIGEDFEQYPDGDEDDDDDDVYEVHYVSDDDDEDDDDDHDW